MIVFGYKAKCQPLGNGSDGSPSISGIVNLYSYLIQDAIQCSQKLEVADASLFSRDNLILIIQMQGAAINESNATEYGEINNYSGAGNYEYAKIESVSNNNIYLKYPLLNNYEIKGKVQVIKVPQYNSPTVMDVITCPAWDGTTGGVVAIDATGVLTLNDNIEGTGNGFRGGEVINGPDYISDTTFLDESPSLVGNASKGEGISFYGVVPFTSARGAPANAGGGGNSHTAGGGGGSNFGCGGQGGWGYPVDVNYKLASGIGGHSLNSTDKNRIFLGGGGGAGSSHADKGTRGGNGGPIVIITANNISGNNNAIIAKGDTSESTFSAIHSDGIGGGGGGGTVLISATTITGNLLVDISGGNGGNSSLLGAGPGGGGGGGLCWINSPFLPSSVSVIAQAGVAGTANGNFYGALNGCDGGISLNLSIPFNETKPAILAKFDFSETRFLEILLSNKTLEATKWWWDFGDGTIDSISNPMYIYQQPGIYQITFVAYDSSGCSDTTFQHYISGLGNVFTPNGDGVNDFFSFQNYDTINYSVNFKILNRWGDTIFKSDNEQKTWDGTVQGKNATEGTYYYLLEIIDIESTQSSVKKGFITLLR